LTLTRRFGPFALAACLFTGCSQQQRIVLYSAQEKEFADTILADFEKQSALPVTAHYDNEANKSVGLLDDLIREAKQPRCDVHWNNEIIGTIRLQRLGVLEPYGSPAAQQFPNAFRASDHTWTAFAGRVQPGSFSGRRRCRSP
jgi:iron(III) transport system substrate-binding protein